ncbi:BURP domain protein USPL1-like [Carica papaya]|uniref:BURP domain protein USPL1-like n=1 Tax=Carica papaya TaxID=3649 RepID=UPI000B8C994B|nr:BURP domain protein USPL1-like [Carica papaya]XP_021896738.1 BURP domain protein USPL1-like [Carica papaya]
MASGFPCWSIIIIFFILLVLTIAQPCSGSGRMIYESEWKEEDRDYVKHDGDVGDHDQKKAIEINGHDRPSSQMDPSVNIFVTINTLEIGKRMRLYFNSKDPSISPHLLPREETDSIPFSSSKLPYLLEFFSLSATSPQAKSMAYTLKECEDADAVKEEVKFCATSLESMLDSLQTIFGSNPHLKVLTTRFKTKLPATLLQNYTILEAPKEIFGAKMVACHTMPYPYAVFFCHGGGESGWNRVFEVSLGGDNGESVEAVVVCHMNTSEWDPDHASFRLLNVQPRTCPVCHVLPLDDLVWVQPIIY